MSYEGNEFFLCNQLFGSVGWEGPWPHQALLEGIKLLDRVDDCSALEMMWNLGVYVRTPKYRFCSLFWKKSKKIFSLEAFMIFKHCRVMRIFFRFFVLFPKSRNKLLPMYITRESYSCNPYLITTASHQVIRPTYFSYFTGSSPGFLGGGVSRIICTNQNWILEFTWILYLHLY